MDIWQNIMTHVTEIWQASQLSFDIFWPFIIIIIFAILFRYFTNRIQNFIAHCLKKFNQDLDEDLIRQLHVPIRLLILSLGLFLSFSTLNYLPEFLHYWLQTITKAVVAFFIFQILYVLLIPIGHWISENDRLVSKTLSALLIKTLRIVIIITGGMTILEIFSIEVTHIIAGFGLMGVAVALGAQELFKNLIAGLLILSERRFAIGDIISVNGVITGTVEDIGLRSTLIRQYNLEPAFVPNHMLAENSMVNVSQMSHRRIYWLIGLEYGTTHQQLCHVRDAIEQYLRNHGGFVTDPNIGLYVKIDSFAPSSIDIMIYCFTQTKSWTGYIKAKEDLALEVKKIVEDAEASFAFPSQTLYIDKSAEDSPKPFLS